MFRFVLFLSPSDLYPIHLHRAGHVAGPRTHRKLHSVSPVAYCFSRVGLSLPSLVDARRIIYAQAERFSREMHSSIVTDLNKPLSSQARASDLPHPVGYVQIPPTITGRQFVPNAEHAQ